MDSARRGHLPRAVRRLVSAIARVRVGSRCLGASGDLVAKDGAPVGRRDVESTATPPSETYPRPPIGYRQPRNFDGRPQAS